MSNLSNAEIAALLWNKTNEVPFSELSDEKRTELEVAIAAGDIDGDVVVVEVLPDGEVPRFVSSVVYSDPTDRINSMEISEAQKIISGTDDPWKGKKLVDKLKKGKK